MGVSGLNHQPYLKAPVGSGHGDKIDKPSCLECTTCQALSQMRTWGRETLHELSKVMQPASSGWRKGTLQLGSTI